MSHECFADEIAIDFPSVGRVVERIRDAFLGQEADGGLLRAEVSLNVPIRVTCPDCGGRGETWTEPCNLCGGNGHSTFDHPLRITLPPRVADGACFRFRIKSPDATALRVEVRIAVRKAVNG